MELERVSKISQDQFFNDYLISNKPVVVTDAMNSWDLSKFTPESLIGSHGDEMVQIYDSLFDFKSVNTLGNYVKKYFNGDNEDIFEYVRWYTKLKNLEFFWADEFFKSIQEYWNHPYFLARESYLLPYTTGNGSANITKVGFPYKGIFISGKNAKTNLHSDPFNSNAILCQLYGEKRIILFHPNQKNFLSDTQGFSKLDEPDMTRFPNFNLAEATYNDVLLPGEIVFFPSGWLHEVTSITDSVSITWNFLHSTERHKLIDFLSTYPKDNQIPIIHYFLTGSSNRVSEIDDLLSLIA